MDGEENFMIPVGTRVRIKELTKARDSKRYSAKNADPSAPRWVPALAKLAKTEGIVAKSGFGKHSGTDVRFSDGQFWCFFEEDLEIMRVTPNNG